MEADKDKILNRLGSELIKDVVMGKFEVKKLESVVAETEKIVDAQVDFNAANYNCLKPVKYSNNNNQILFSFKNIEKSYKLSKRSERSHFLFYTSV